MAQQNEYITSCMHELLALGPLKGGEGNPVQQGDTTESVNAAKERFKRIQARIRRIVASRDEYITEIHEGQPSEHMVYDEIGINLKIRIQEKPAPLTISFHYPENPSIKGVQLFHSQNVKEPKAV